MKKILMVALNGSLLSSLDLNEYEVYLLEEEEIYYARPERYQYPIIKDIKFGGYQQSNGFLEQAIKWHKEIGFHGVVPGLEYAVQAVNTLAERIELSRPGKKAVQAFTNKFQLREHCKLANIPHPDYKKVKGIDEIFSFFKGQPLVIKPANRRSSVGVIKINRFEEIEPAWQECISVDEGFRTVKTRNLTWEYIVEEFMEGQEVSIETFVHNSQPIFHNITLKRTTEGPHFVELAHTVPAPISKDLKEELISFKEKLLHTLDTENGLFHSEWKITEDGPKIIECASRAPGDYIPKLISIAYGFNFYEAYIQVLMGKNPQVNTDYCKVAKVEYFNPPEGIIENIEGIEFLRDLPQVEYFDISKKIGDKVKPLLSSMDRIGQYIITSETHDDLSKVAQQINNNVIFTIR
ncbi:ATP-grasp domain-containing protein [Cytobacillus firmus]|uniref:ATP-grasp domain-containing protein n=1 Tax=Cytobacillus firmus TaxID=1399 RepID=A0A800MXM9_CYTFI|nr:ATP-grasp domain-containing protein [Cytobacillus firmus]KAF0824291.1 hypothetical protein KIS1582_1970 [Cytobacillus firmus]